MRRGGRFRIIGRLTLGAVALVALMAGLTAAMASAATGEVEYKAAFHPQCVVDPGVLNVAPKEQLTVTVSAVGPERVSEGEEFSFHGASATFEAQPELSNDFVATGINEAKGHLTSLVLDNAGAEPSKLNIAMPPEYPSGLPFLDPVNQGKVLILRFPSKTLGETGLTYSFGPLKVTASAPEEVVSTLDSAPGYIEVEPGRYKATGEGMIMELEGFKSGERLAGPFTVACNVPSGITFSRIVTGPPPPECFGSGPEIKSLSPNNGPFRGGTTVTIKGCNFTGATGVSFNGAPAKSFTVNSSTSITAVSPPGFGPGFGPVVVTTPSGSNEPTPGPDEFTWFHEEPAVLSVEPRQGPSTGGTSVKIRGGGLGEVTQVHFGEAAATGFAIDSENEITAISPPGSGTVEVTAESPFHRSSGVNFTYIPAVEKAELKNWVFSGTLTPKKLAQAITLPTGATFNGNVELNPETGAGSVTGSFSVPAFSAPVKLFGFVPVTLGVTLAQVGQLEGSLEKSAATPGDEVLKLPTKLQLGITSVKLLGVSISTKCSSVEPLALALSDTLSREELLHKGWSFAGTTSIPKFKCEGGFLGALFGDVLTTLLSGPESAYALKVSAP